MTREIATNRFKYTIYKRQLYALFFTFSFVISSNLSAQGTASENKERLAYKRIRIENPHQEVLKTLQGLGIDLSCGSVFTSNSLQLELDTNSLGALDKKGISYTIVVENLSSYYAKNAVKDLPKARKKLEELKKSSAEKTAKDLLRSIGQNDYCEEIDWAVPTNFNLNPNASPNTFGGCLTYSQVLQELDDMRAQYPNLISLKLDASASNQTTIEGRTIYYVRISDNPDIDEPSEPETLYQSLIHSREASSVMQLLYYMWYVLENYNTDQGIANLVNNQALYFIPVFNPDGFVYNETQNPDGGGLQRKNRNIGTGGCGTYSDGIDLNRNAAYYWGNGGASTNPCSGTYLGTSPFSENETQIMRDFFLEHDFKLALNHHSYKNAMLHAYAGTTITNPRPDEYSKYSHDMSIYNRYAYGPSTSISSLNSGNMNDWMLGGPAGTSTNGTPTGTGSGKNTLAWTPENGSASEGGFWPLPSNFVLIAKRAMRMNFLAAYFSGKYAKLHDLNQSGITSLTGNLIFGIENLGQTESDFTVTVTPVSSNIVSTAAAVTTSGMAVLDQNEVPIGYALNSSIEIGDQVEFKVTLSNDYAADNVLYETNIVKIYNPTVLFNDNPDSDGLTNWTQLGGVWNLTSDAYSGTSAITSSISQPYSNFESKTLQINNSINTEGAEKVSIQYFAKWDLERSFDYVQLEGSIDGTFWTPLCGVLTKPGAPDENNTYSNKSSSENMFQPDNEPLYDGDTQGKWNKEEITVDNESNSFIFNQSTVYLRFHFKTDGSNSQDAYYNANFEGFSFDDFTCIVIENAPLGVNELNANVCSIYPNPSNGQFTLDIENSNAENVIIYDVLGKEIITFPVRNKNKETFNLDVKPGLYFMHLTSENSVALKKLLIR